MKDRKPRHPGRVKLEPVAGQENVFDMTRADDPEDPGTPMNKQTMLTDEAAADVGLDPDGDYTPNDAFTLLGKYTARKPGDILETVRTNPGDRWLLCSGDIVREGQYPKLREVMPYNTEWRKVAQYHLYTYVRAMPIAGQWALIDVFRNTEARGKVAGLYDANTDTYTPISCPTINTEYRYGIFGLTHDGDRYILGVNEDSNDTVYAKVHLFVSTDLVNWTDARQFTVSGYDQPYDLTFAGANVLVATYTYDYNKSSYEIYLYGTDKALTTTVKRSGYWNPEYLLYFSVLPDGYWSFHRDGSESISVYRGYNEPSVFTFSYSGLIALFSDKYWIGTQSKGKIARYIEVYNTETKKLSNIYAGNLLVDISIAYSVYYEGCEYNKNTNEWELYLHTSESGGVSTYRYYIAYISADADPNDVTQYRVVRVESLPELHNVQMAPDRSKMTGDNLLRDPNQKYLPKHSGDTMKYIYTG